MISRIRGEVLTRDPDRVELLTSGGVVYEVHVPARVAEDLPPQGRSVELLTTMLVRDDSHALYGFRHAHERTLFARLRKVPNVGAASALAVLSTYSVDRVVRAVAEKDRAALMAVKGIGKKTADLMVVALRGKLDDLAVSGAHDSARTAGLRDAVAALVSLGLTFQKADEAVREASRDGQSLATPDLVRRVLMTRSPERGR